MIHMIFRGVEFGDHDVVSAERCFEFLVFRLGILAVSAPRGLEEYEGVLAADFGLEITTDYDFYVVFLAKKPGLCLRFNPALQCPCFVAF